MIIGKPLTASVSGGLKPEIIATAPNGATVTANGILPTRTVVGEETTDFIFGNLLIGSYLLISTNGQKSVTKTVTVDRAAQFRVDMPFHEFSVESVGTYFFAKGSVLNPDPARYDGVYESNNKGHHSTQAVSKITFSGYDVFRAYIRSYAEGNHDYTIASTLDASSYPTSSSGSNVKAHTSGNQQSGTTLSNYTLCEYPNDGGEHFIYIVYIKDSWYSTGDDKGYFLIEK